MPRFSNFKWAAPLVALGAFLAFAAKMNTNPPTNSARTSSTDADLELRPTIIESPPELAAKSIAGLSLRTYGRSWKFVAQKQVSKDEIQLLFHVPVVVFTDILTVTLKRKDSETIQVDVESHSQIGQGDFGENRRHVRQMMNAISEKLNAF